MGVCAGDLSHDPNRTADSTLYGGLAPNQPARVMSAGAVGALLTVGLLRLWPSPIAALLSAAAGGGVAAWWAQMAMGRRSRWLLVVLGAALATVATYPSLSQPVDQLARHLVLLPILIAAGWVDLRQHRIPNQLISFGLVAGGALMLISPQDPWWGAPAGAGGAFAIMLVIALITGMGMGDVKLAAVIGLFASGQLATWWAGPVAALALGFGSAAVLTLPLVLLGRLRLKSAVPMGPFLAIGAVLCSLL